MICAVISGPFIDDVRRQMEIANPHVDLFEWRCDLFAFVPDLKLRQEVTKPLLITARKEIDKLVQLNPDYMDIDHSLTYEGKMKRVCSFHDFEQTPEDLEGLYRKLQATSAHYYKMALKANCPQDALRLMLFARGKPIIPISMGPFGQFSRILAKVIGAPWTYALPEANSLSSLGLLTAQDLRETYRFHSLTPESTIYGLIGDPVAHSIGHRFHNNQFSFSQKNSVYVKIPMPLEHLQESLNLMKKLPFKGLSVTMPLKREVLSFLQFVDPEAIEIGAVNTIGFECGKICGINTDGKGALNSLRNHGLKQDDRILILGRGGAAQAISYEAKKRGHQTTMLSRQEMASLKELPLHEALINCTPLEMACDPMLFHPGSLVMDIRVSSPPHLWLEEAQARGCRILDFKPMFEEQALLQQKYWQTEVR